MKTKPAAYISLMDASNDLVFFIIHNEEPYGSLELFKKYANNLENAVNEAAKLNQGKKFITRELKRIFVHSFKYKCRHLSTHLIKKYANYYIPLVELCTCKRILHQSDFYDCFLSIKNAFGEKRFYEFRDLCVRYRGCIIQNYNSYIINVLFNEANILLNGFNIACRDYRYNYVGFAYNKNTKLFTSSLMPYFRATLRMLPNICLKILHNMFGVYICNFSSIEKLFINKKKLLSPEILFEMYGHREDKTPECELLMIIYCVERKKWYDDIYRIF